MEALLLVSEEAAKLGVRVAYATAWGEPVSSLDPGALDGEVEELARVYEGWTLEKLTGHPLVRAYRSFYWRLGVDPTKTRPSAEALVRRLLRGRFPRVNPVVDAGNIASARYLVPVGIYDLDRFQPPAVIRVSEGGEVFHPIGGAPTRLPRGLPIMVDSRGVVMHVYPHRDSVETMVREDTRRVLIVAAGVPGVEAQRLLDTVGEVLRLLGKLGWTASTPRLAPESRP